MEMLDKNNSLMLEVTDDACPFENYDVVKMLNEESTDINEEDPYYILRDKEDWSYWYVKYFDNNIEPRLYSEHIMKYFGDKVAQDYGFKTHEGKLISDGIEDNIFYATKASWSMATELIPFPEIDEQKDISYYKTLITKQCPPESFDMFCKAILLDVLLENEDRSAENLFFRKTEDGLVFDYLSDNDIGTVYNILDDEEDKFLLMDIGDMSSEISNVQQVIYLNKKAYDEFVEQTDIEKICSYIKEVHFLTQDEKNFMQKRVVAQFQKIKDVDK